MTTELHILAWALVLALIQVLLPSVLRSHETGLRYKASARDKPATPPGKLTGRLMRAQANLFETLPVFAIAILITHMAGRAATDSRGERSLRARRSQGALFEPSPTGTASRYGVSILRADVKDLVFPAICRRS